MDIELILQKISGKKKIFKKNGELTKVGYEAYAKLIDIIYNLGDIDVICEKDVNPIINKIDEVIDGPVY